MGFFIVLQYNRNIQMIYYSYKEHNETIINVNHLIIGTKKVHCATHRSPFYVLGRSPL